MIEKIRKIYHKIVSEKCRKKIAEILYNMRVKRKIISLYWTLLFGYICGRLKEYNKEIRFIAKHGVTMFPYQFTRKYSGFSCEIIYDKHEEKYYVLHEDKRLYFPKGAKPEEIQSAYKQLIMEQEADSPHCYWSNINRPQKGDTFVDVGAAEGMIALEWIDVVDKVILIECEKLWQDALMATFASYKEKVQIISSYCGEKDGPNSTTIDSIVENTDNIVIKMDIEGAEIDALKGAKKTLNRDNVKWAICTYHRKTDAHDIEEVVKEHQMEYEYSDGYMLLPYDEIQEYPYFRKGLIRAKK